MAEVRVSGDLQRKLAEIGQKLGSARALQVGFLSGATYPDGTPVALVAAVQNYGAPSRGIPPRPFFSGMVADHQDEWSAELAGFLDQTGYDAKGALGLLGELIKGELQQSIRDTNEPPLKASTVARKGFDKPLIDTAHMLNSVDYRVS